MTAVTPTQRPDREPARAALPEPPAASEPGSLDAGLTVRWVGDRTSLAMLEKHWWELEMLSASPVFFQSFPWVTAAAELAPARPWDEELAIILVEDRGRPCLILPLAVSSFGGVRVARWLGTPLWHYGDVLAAPWSTDRHFRAAWDALLEHGRPDLVLLRQVRDDSSLGRLHGGRLSPLPGHGEARFIDLANPALVETWLEQERASRPRSSSRSADPAVPSFEVLRGGDARDLISRAIALEVLRVDQLGLRSSVFHDTARQTAFWRLATGRIAGAEATVSVLRAGQEAAAVEVGFAHGGDYYACLGAVDPRHAGDGLGELLRERTIRWCRDTGVGRYHLPASVAPGAAGTGGRVAVRDHARAVSLLGRLTLDLFYRRLEPLFWRLRERAIRLTPELEAGRLESA